MKVLVATRSAHKLNEIQAILAQAGLDAIELVTLDQIGIAPSDAEDDLEPWETFEENARSKAQYFHRLSGLPVLADDSGLVVDALGGAPGVRSKRFAPGSLTGELRDQANNAHLLKQLERVPDEERTARYVCVVSWVAAEGASKEVRGEVEGRIVREPQGTNGFGYDPHFHVQELGRTFGLASAQEKHALSHRGRAFRAILPELRQAAGHFAAEEER